MKRKLDAPAQITRVSAPSLSAERFREEFAEPHVPCVLERCAHDWPALDSWTFDAIAIRIIAARHTLHDRAVF